MLFSWNQHSVTTGRHTSGKQSYEHSVDRTHSTEENEEAGNPKQLDESVGQLDAQEDGAELHSDQGPAYHWLEVWGEPFAWATYGLG